MHVKFKIPPLLVSRSYREVQHLCDSQSPKCEEHHHRCQGQPAQLGARLHVVSPLSSSHQSLSLLCSPLIWFPLQPLESFFFTFFFPVHPKCPLSQHCSTLLFCLDSVHPPPTSASSSPPCALPRCLCCSHPPRLHFGSPPAHLSSPLSVLLHAASDLHLPSPSSLLSLPYFTPSCYLLPLPTSPFSQHH